MQIDHLGYLTHDLEKSLKTLLAMHDLDLEVEQFIDENQEAKIAFFRNPDDPCGVKIELLEPLNGSSHLHNYLTKNPNGHLHHICYLVEDLEEALAYQKKIGSMMIKRPVPAVAFEGRKVVFLLSKDKKIFELVEKHAKANP